MAAAQRITRVGSPGLRTVAGDDQASAPNARGSAPLDALQLAQRRAACSAVDSATVRLPIDRSGSRVEVARTSPRPGKGRDVKRQVAVSR